MNLYFLRHAKAYPRSRKWTPDSKRPLTPEGEEKMCEVARGMKELDLSFDIILTSPYVRALRTAEIAAEVLKQKKKLKVTESLVSEADPKQIIEEIRDEYTGLNDIALVGHEPHMSNTMSLLLVGDGSLQIDFKKAGLTRLSIERLQVGKCACLGWIMTPNQVASLA